MKPPSGSLGTFTASSITDLSQFQHALSCALVNTIEETSYAVRQQINSLAFETSASSFDRPVGLRCRSKIVYCMISSAFSDCIVECIPVVRSPVLSSENVSLNTIVFGFKVKRVWLRAAQMAGAAQQKHDFFSQNLGCTIQLNTVRLGDNFHSQKTDKKCLLPSPLPGTEGKSNYSGCMLRSTNPPRCV